MHKCRNCVHCIEKREKVTVMKQTTIQGRLHPIEEMLLVQRCDWYDMEKINNEDRANKCKHYTSKKEQTKLDATLQGVEDIKVFRLGDRLG